MKPQKIHILYEHGIVLRPQASSSIRLLRPFSHPALQGNVEVTVGRVLSSETPDVVIVDRLWKPDVCPADVEVLAADVHRRGAKLVYSTDDNFFLLPNPDAVPEGYQESFQRFLELSDGVIVSTPELQQAFSHLPRVVYLPTALDERLIVQKSLNREARGRLTIGYMGTSTHNEDLRMVLPALKIICKKFPGRIRLQFIGVIDQVALAQWEVLRDLPIEILRPSIVETEYPAFMLWFTGETRWDFGIAPLVDSRFNHYKSDIKFLDYTAAAVPGIFSKVTPYANTILPGQTALLVENTTEAWVAAMDQMIESRLLRAKLLQNANRYLYEERVLARCAANWLAAIDQALGESD